MKNIKIFLFISVLIFSVGIFSKAFAADDIATVNITCNSGPAGYTKFANENETYNNLPAGNKDVVFGCIDRFSTPQIITATSVTCDTTNFGDPYGGAVKACFYKATPTVIDPTAPINSITQTTAILGATVSSLGTPATLTARGVQYTTNAGVYSSKNPATLSQTINTPYTVSVTGLTCGTKYYYRGYATNASGDGYSSPDATFTTLPCTPTGLTATPGTCGTGSVTISWTASTGVVTGYQLRDGTSGIYDNTATSFTHTGLSAGSSHTYTVRSKNSSGYSPYTSGVTVTAPNNCALTVTKTDPSNSATITSTPAGGISCGADCNESYTSGTNVTVNAPAVSNYSVAMSDGCTATGAVGVGASCSVKMEEDKNVNVTYTSAGNATLTVTKEGSGSVSSEPVGISCGVDCSQSYTTGTYVELTASPSSGSVFAGWVSDDCNNTVGKCAVTMDKSKTVKAVFKYTHTVTFDGNGSNGGSTATQTFVEGETKNLNANGYTRTNYTFAGWNTLANGTGTSYADQASYTMGTSNVILYAMWNSNTTGDLSSTNCEISAGNNSCTTSLSWTTTNPISGYTSAVTTPTNITVGTPANNGSATYTINYNSTRVFYLYHNSIELDRETPTATCVSGTAWDSVTSTCKSTSTMTGTISATNCTIPLNGTSCNIPITWSTTNPVGTSQVTTPTNVVVGNGNSGSTTFSTGATGMRTFYLYNNAQELGIATSQAVCASGSTWINGSCVDTSSTLTLTLAKNTSSTGTGTMIGTLNNGNTVVCDSSCSSASTNFISGSYVTIRAIPDTGSAFVSWSSWFTGSTNPRSNLLLDNNRTVRALFNSTTSPSTNYSLNVIVLGTGTVISNPSGITCTGGSTSSDCSESYSLGTMVALSKTSTSLETVTWGGDCNSSGQVTMDTDKTCTATFGTTTPATDPVISNFSITDRIIIGGTAIATWNSSGAISCKIRDASTQIDIPGATGLAVSGSHNLKPTETTTYELVCTNGTTSVSSNPDEKVIVIDPDYNEN